MFSSCVGAGANAVINASCQFPLVSSADKFRIRMLHKNKVIGSRWVSITEARNTKIAASTQLEDDNGYGVGTIEYEIEVLGAGFSVRLCDHLSTAGASRSLAVICIPCSSSLLYLCQCCISLRCLRLGDLWHHQSAHAKSVVFLCSSSAGLLNLHVQHQ